MNEADIAAVRASARRLESRADAARSFIDRATSQSSSIATNWQGNAANSFQSSFSKHISTLKDIADKASVAAIEVNHFADEMQRELDRERAEAAAAAAAALLG